MEAQLQLDALLAAGVQNRDVFDDVTSGSKTAMERPGMTKLLEYAEAGDTVTVGTADGLVDSVDVPRGSVTRATMGRLEYCGSTGESGNVDSPRGDNLGQPTKGQKPGSAQPRCP